MLRAVYWTPYLDLQFVRIVNVATDLYPPLTPEQLANRAVVICLN